MLRLLSYLLGLLIFPSVQGGIVSNSKDQSFCVLQDEPRQCGSFCLAALSPLFDHSRNIRKRLDEIEAGQTALKDSFRMTTAQGQEDLQAGLDSRLKLAEEQHMAVNSEMKNQLQELGNKVSKISTKEDFANSIQALQTKLDSRLDRTEEQLRTMKITANANDELKVQVTTLKDTITDLQSQLKISEVQTKSKEDILKVKEEVLTNKDKQISDLTTKIKAIKKTKSELSSQLSELRKIDDKLKISEGQTKLKEDILKVKEEQIKSQHEHLKNRDVQIADLRNQIKAIEKTKSELSRQLSECRKTDDNLPDSCPSGSPNGIYQIKVRGLEPFKVPCVSSPYGWTVIQRRIDGSENFNRTWNDYKSGFGNVSGEFFIGLEKLHRMTEARPHELYIKLGKVNGSTSYAHYDDFKIGSEKELYELKNVGKYSGEAGDSLSHHKSHKFSTFDRDNDNKSDGNCGSFLGPWWHNNCSFSSLNGKYFKDGKGNGINWGSWHNNDWQISLTFTEMLIRPKSL